MSDDLDIPKGARTSSDPIEGGVVVVNGAVPPGEDGHEVYRTLTNDELRQREQERSVAIAQNTQARWAMLRIERDRRLIASDWTELPSAADRLTPEQAAAWTTYRQQLRDMPDVTSDPDDPPWPDKPGGDA